MSDLPYLGISCGNCGGNVLMATCHHFRGTGHEWVLVGICMVCRAVHWTDDGCLDCRQVEKREGRQEIVPFLDGDLNLLSKESA